MLCPYCGAANDNQEKNCNTCGKKIVSSNISYEWTALLITLTIFVTLIVLFGNR